MALHKVGESSDENPSKPDTRSCPYLFLHEFDENMKTDKVTFRSIPLQSFLVLVTRSV